MLSRHLTFPGHLCPANRGQRRQAEAYADDVNLILPRKEESIREVFSLLDKFEQLSGLKVNTDKTQVLRIGKDATSDPILCPDLGLKWVNKLKILGINLMATPSEMQSNLTDAIEDIEKLLNRWTFRNLTVYGRILVVKALALSKVTHLVQVIPNPSPTSILNLQRIINKFIWKGNAQKKVVVSQAIAELPEKKGGLAIPNLQKFWDSLKLAWLTRLIQGDESSTWKRLSLSKLSLATNIPKLTSKKLLSIGPTSLAQASRLLNNQFWQSLFKLMPQLERTFYLQNLKIIGEKVIWNTDDLLLEGKPFDRKLSSVQISQSLTTISSFLSENTHVLMSENEAAEKLGYGNIPQWNLMVSAITEY